MILFIFRRKKLITLLSGALIIFAFFFKAVIGNLFVSEVAFFIASLIGLIPIFLQAYQALKIKVVSIDVLVTLAVIGALALGNYEESAMVSFLFLFGEILEQKTLIKTRQAIKELVDLTPLTALKLMNDKEFREVRVDEVIIGDILLVKTGAVVPVDGRVFQGEAYINEAAITGESFPVKKNIGSCVYAGSILDNGTIQIKTEKIGEDTTFGKIIQLVEEAQDSKSKAEKFIDKFAKYYTPIVLLIAILVGLILWDIPIAITILVLGCPGALVIGVPVANVAGIGNGARNGVLFKGSEVISALSKVDVIAFDKTGTLTIGKPQVTVLKHYSLEEDSISREVMLNYLFSVEKESDHPLAKAIVAALSQQTAYPVHNTVVIKGRGISATIEKREIIIGNIALMEEKKIIINPLISDDINTLQAQGNSLVLVALEGQLKILIGIKDKTRENLKEDFQELKRMGIKNLLVLSGDNQKIVDLVANELGLKSAHGSMLPEDKAKYIASLQANQQIVAFVGDGVNDSPSLARANIGIAMGGGTDVAIQTSDVVLMNSDFKQLSFALGLSKAIVKNIKQNILIALAVVVGLLVTIFLNRYFHFAKKMMAIGMLVHEASILLVILNGMRLLRYKYKRKEKRK